MFFIQICVILESPELWVFLPFHATLPGPLHHHHHPSHPVPLGRHRRPSWARCTTERRHRSSPPDPDPLLRRPSWVESSSGRCDPSRPEPHPGTLHRRWAAVPPPRGSALATRPKRREVFAGRCGGFGGGKKEG